MSQFIQTMINLGVSGTIKSSTITSNGNGVIEGAIINKGVFVIHGNISFQNCRFNNGVELHLKEGANIQIIGCYFDGGCKIVRERNIFEWIESKTSKN